MDRRVTSPTWGLPPPCKQALSSILYWSHCLVLLHIFQKVINNSWAHHLSRPLKSVTCSCFKPVKHSQTKKPGGGIWFQSQGSAGLIVFLLHWYSLLKNFILISILYIKKYKQEWHFFNCTWPMNIINTATDTTNAGWIFDVLSK